MPDNNNQQNGASSLLDLFAPLEAYEANNVETATTATTNVVDLTTLALDEASPFQNRNNAGREISGGPLNASPRHNFRSFVFEDSSEKKHDEQSNQLDIPSLVDKSSFDEVSSNHNSLQRPSFHRDMTEKRLNLSSSTRTQQHHSLPLDEHSRLLQSNNQQETSSLLQLFDSPEPTSSNSKDEVSNSNSLLSTASRRNVHHQPRMALTPVKELVPHKTIAKIPNPDQMLHSFKNGVHSCTKHSQDFTQATTWVGSVMFLLYHVVFCLTMGSSIIRPHASTSMLGLMTKVAALGIILGAPVYWISMAHDVPALYPTVDLFCAPFLANIATIIDQVLYDDPTITTKINDEVFLATFGFLASCAVFLSGTLLILASVFKLANLAAFLPYPVLCGFFAAVGILTWTLAFKIDTGGHGVGKVVWSGDRTLIMDALFHHVPSLFVAITMKWLGPKHPFYVVSLVLLTISIFYLIMLLFGVSMETMIENGWFWSQSDLVYKAENSPIGYSVLSPPAPFGWISLLLRSKVHWRAVKEGMGTTIALSFLYLIRCSLHGAALKKSVPNMRRVVTEPEIVLGRSSLTRDKSTTFEKRLETHKRTFSEALDIENIVSTAEAATSGNEVGEGRKVITPKAMRLSLKEVLLQYGYSQFVCGFVGSFAITPCVAAAPAMFMVGAEKVTSQVGSSVLLFAFYLTNFRLVSYIPKPAFSSLLVLACIDMIGTWFIKSYCKTKEKMEWLVVPAIVIFAFVVGLLNAVFLGIGMSTFLFVAAFFRSGVVKYVANGLTIRSTIERPLATAKFLDQYGDFIQILVLQNYLFFGNASSALNYIASMFEDAPPEIDPISLPPLPKIIILDLTLVTGMDTSAVDVIADILNLCNHRNCKLFLAGVCTSLRQVMSLGGVKPELTRNRAERKLRFFPSLDLAIGKAEDMIIDDESFEDSLDYSTMAKGFDLALLHIDVQHDTNFSEHLVKLGKYTTLLVIEPSHVLYEDEHLERGLFFIESGLMKIERNSSFTLSRAGGSSSAMSQIRQNEGSLSHLHARIGSIGREMARLKANGVDKLKGHTFRVARIGPGWVLGSIEALSGLVHPGSLVAVTQCQLHYISYEKIQEIEEDDPRLVLHLHKLLSFLMAKRQSVTIDQLATLHSIMTAPAQKKPLSRSAGAKHMSSLNSASTLYN